MLLRSFRRFCLSALALCAVLLATPSAPRADDMAMAMPAGAKGEILKYVKDAEDKLTQLSTAMPESKYSWRPGKGVRSVGEVYMHVAAANFGIPTMMGVAAPAGFDFNTYEKSLTKKADIQKALKDSFAHLETTIMNASDADMEKQIDMMGSKMTERSALMLMMAHCHEHLGQSIAYARSNGVAPPWTAAQVAALKAATSSKK